MQDKAKYHNASEYLALKSLIYFEDAEYDGDPEVMIMTRWKQIKEFITNAHRSYMNNL